MIGLAIVGIMVTVLMTVVGNLSDMTGNLAAMEELDIVMQKVQNVLLTEDTCVAAINPIVGTPITYAGGDLQLQDVSVTNTLGNNRIALIRRGELAQIEGTVQNPDGSLTRRDAYDGKIRIDDILIRPLVTLTPPTREMVSNPPPAPPTEYITYVVELKVRSSYNGRTLPEQSVPMKLYTAVGSGGQIQRCFSIPADRYESCWAFGGREVDGRCDLPECSADTITTLPDNQRRECWAGPGCTPRNPGYFWVFRGGEGGNPSLPVCVCLEDCS